MQQCGKCRAPKSDVPVSLCETPLSHPAAFFVTHPLGSPTVKLDERFWRPRLDRFGHIVAASRGKDVQGGILTQIIFG